MRQNPDAAGTKYRIFKDVIMKLQARAEITGEIASLHMARLPRPDLGVPLEAIQQLDKFLTCIPHLNTEVLPPPLLRIKNALVELHTDDTGNMRGTTPLQWLSDDWAYSQHVRVVQDFAELCINCGQEVASYSDEEWQLIADKTSSDWRSVLAEMLRIQACRVDIELSVRKLCKRRLRSLVRTHGVLPFTFNVSGLNMPPHPVSGGGYSDIYKGGLDKEVVCIKVLRIFTTGHQSDKIYKELAREVLIWKELSHPNVLPLLGIDLITRKPSCCLVSPWMKNGNVIAFLETYPDFNKCSLVRDIASGLEYLHNLDPPVVHGDIKGGNILIDDDGQACLADFGLALAVESQALSASSAGSSRGTLRWLAPEILDSSRKAERQASPTKRDIYAFGCTILEIYTGRHPFPQLQNVEVIHHVVTKRERPEIPSNAVEQLKDLHPLLKRCWHNNPRQRPNATEIRNVLLLEPLEWKKAVEGSTSPSSMLRKLSAPLGQWSPPISLTLQSHFIIPTTTQFISTQVLGSGQSEEASRTIDAGLAESKKTLESKKRAFKILLLGQSESGKSSVLLNLRQALTPKYFESERLAWKTVIQLNLISLTKIILLVLQDEWKALEADTPESKHATPLTTEHRRLALSLSPLIAFETSIGQMMDSTTGGYQTRNDPSLVTQVLAASKNEIIALFEDVLVRGVLKSHGVYLQDDCGFFMDDTARIAALDYVPTDCDIIRTRKRIPGVEEHRFVTEAGARAGTEFYITEISGSRSQRSAWIPYLDDVQAILFLVPLIFWQYLDEDPRVNRVQESLDLWREIVGNPLLAKTALIVLFNKKDVLQKHIDAGVKVKKYVPSYGDRPNDVVSVTKYFRNKFSEYHQKLSPEPRTFIFHETEATDTKLASVVLGHVLEQTDQNLMKIHGFM
ncbi:G-protein alpha subunit-domain-containing protein [Mycena galopus ATCC 62051]|nr:G-protein alpha subunit-domain-containing protein [Mycena galopus ATCC 62051]